jgi:hypothetical protein
MQRRRWVGVGKDVVAEGGSCDRTGDIVRCGSESISVFASALLERAALR